MLNFIKNNKGWAIIIILCFFPVLLWVINAYGESRFSNFSVISLSIGQLSALVGTAMYSITLFLSARLKIFERYFNGLNKVYENHSRLGQLALVLLLFHPFLLLPTYAPSISEAANFLIPSSNWDRNWGIFSLSLMITLIIITLYLRPKYNIWKLTHKFLGVAFFFGALHVWFIPSDTLSFLPLRVYMLGLASMGLLAFFYRTLFGIFLIPKYSYVVEGLNKLNEIITEITLRPLNKVMTFTPGQFLFVQFFDKAVTSEGHPFSIVSAKSDTQIKIAVKNLGDYTSTISNLNIGSKALIEGPFGVFSYLKSTQKSQLWIAGGVGITPFMSMARSFLPNDNYEVDLIYCVNNPAEAVYLDELAGISEASNTTFRIHLFCSEVGGRINAEKIKEIVDCELDYKDIFMCAPPVMIAAIRSQLLKKGIKLSNIHSEEFSF